MTDNTDSTASTPATTSSFLTDSKRFIRSLFLLKEGKAENEAIDAHLRNGINMKGHNLWVLMLAILIASIGLNVNSTAIVIGAMLISPLMGPAMGAGYGIAIYDFRLIKKSAQQLLIASMIGLFTSAIYFLISPLSSVQSELLLRTRPTIWDVAIGLFGGLAGIISATRAEKTNVIPGVAIATALMPPLCTAGFGLATANWEFFFGAAYLFIINCVFITFASVIICRAFRFPVVTYVDYETSQKMRLGLMTAVFVTAVPSTYLAYQLVNEELYKSRAHQFIEREFRLDSVHVVDSEIHAAERSMEITLLGKVVQEDKLDEIRNRMVLDNLQGSELIIHQTGESEIDLISLKASVMSDIYQVTAEQLQAKDVIIQQLQQQILPHRERQDLFSQVIREMATLFPEITEAYLSDAHGWKRGDEIPQQAKDIDGQLLFYGIPSAPLDESDKSKLQQWLITRTGANKVILVIDDD